MFRDRIPLFQNSPYAMKSKTKSRRVNNVKRKSDNFAAWHHVLHHVSTSRMSIYAWIERVCDVLSKLIYAEEKKEGIFFREITILLRTAFRTDGVQSLPLRMIFHSNISTRKIYAYVTNILFFFFFSCNTFGQIIKMLWKWSAHLVGCSSINDLLRFPERPRRIRIYMKTVSRECRLAKTEMCARCDATRARYMQ